MGYVPNCCSSVHTESDQCGQHSIGTHTQANAESVQIAFTGPGRRPSTSLGIIKDEVAAEHKVDYRKVPYSPKCMF